MEMTRNIMNEERSLESLFEETPITFEKSRKIRNRSELENIEKVLPTLKEWLNTASGPLVLARKAIKLEYIIIRLMADTNLLELTKMTRITKKEDKELYYIASRYLLKYKSTVLKAVQLKTYIDFNTSILRSKMEER